MENDKFKDRREVKIIQNEYICKNLVLRIGLSSAFLFNFGHS